MIRKLKGTYAQGDFAGARQTAKGGESRKSRPPALDGGGIRGLVTIEILAKIEDLLRPPGSLNFVLADYFDYRSPAPARVR